MVNVPLYTMGELDHILSHHLMIEKNLTPASSLQDKIAMAKKEIQEKKPFNKVSKTDREHD